MKTTWPIPFLLACLLILAPAVSASDSASIEFFSPEGMVKDVRQVTARFSEAMVPFGDLRLEDPFEVSCPETFEGGKELTSPEMLNLIQHLLAAGK